MKKSSDKAVLLKKLKNFLFNTAIIIALMTIIINLSATVWWSGFLRYFNVPIDIVNFAPSIADLATRGLIAIILVAAASAFYIIFLYILKHLLDWLQRLAARSKNKFIQSFSQSNIGISGGMLYVFAAIVITGVSFSVCYMYSDSIGYDSAQKTSNFSVTEETDEYVKVIIYQNENTGVIKKYDKSTGTFDNGFWIEELTGKTIIYSKNVLNP